MKSSYLVLVFLFLSIISFMDVFCSTALGKYKNIIYVGVLFVLALLAGMREDTYDYANYEMLFQQTPDFITMFYMGDFSYIADIREEPGYMLINSIVKCFTDESEVLFCVISFSTLFFYGISIRRYSKYPMVSIMLYFSMIYLVKEMVQIRHGLAIAIFVYSFRYVLADKFWKFFLCIMLAASFHEAIFFSILIYPLRHMRVNYSYGMFSIFVCIILYVLNIVDNIIFPISEGFAYYTRITSYFGSSYLATADLVRFWKYSVLFICLLFMGKLIRKKYKYYDFMMIVFSTGLIITAMWSAYPFFADRLSAAMWTSMIFILPTLFSVVCGNIWRYLMLLGLIALSGNIFIGNMVMVAN